jgi:hypothetical protein
MDVNTNTAAHVHVTQRCRKVTYNAAFSCSECYPSTVMLAMLGNTAVMLAMLGGDAI